MQKPPKQWIIARKDLAMPPGKLAAQVAHASMGALLAASYDIHADKGPDLRAIPLEGAVEAWLGGAFTKICLEANSEEELVVLYDKALQMGIKRIAKIVDNGLTVFNGVPTLTCVGIGPYYPEEVQELVATWKLYR